MKFLPFHIIYWHIYLFQLENYSVSRYLTLIFGEKFFPSKKLRKKVTWTRNLQILVGVSFLLELCFVFGMVELLFTDLFFRFFAGIISLVLFSYIFFIFLILGYFLLLPFEIYLKKRVILQAKKKLAEYPNLKIIGITGSYGKTTMKEIVGTILSEKYSVLKTPENINTPIGIARLILEKLTAKTEIFVVEMGAYHKGDIADICKLVQPDISFLTGINESHLERFGSIENTIEAKFEIVTSAKGNALVILNSDNQRVRENFEKYLGKRPVLFYGKTPNTRNSCKIENETFFPNGAGISFDLTTAKGTISLKTPLLGEYAPATLVGAVLVAEYLGMSREEITRGALMIRPVEHRLQPIPLPNDILIIDDSYNGNVDGARAAIHLLSRFETRRKIYLTPGLVELGEKAEEIHRMLGKELAKVAHVVLLIRTLGAHYLEQGLLEAGFDKKAIFWYENAKDAHAALPQILVSNDVIVFQNDLPDNYL